MVPEQISPVDPLQLADHINTFGIFHLGDDPPSSEPDPVWNAGDFGERFGASLPRWGEDESMRSWPGSIRTLPNRDGQVPRVYLGDRLAGGTSSLRVATGRFMREPSATNPPVGGPALEEGVHFPYTGGDTPRLFFQDASGNRRATETHRLCYGRNAARISGDYLFGPGGNVGGTHRGFHSESNLHIYRVTATRTAGAIGAGFDIKQSTGAVETTVTGGSLAFTGTALVQSWSVNLNMLGGNILTVKLTGNHTNLQVNVYCRETS